MYLCPPACYPAPHHRTAGMMQFNGVVNRLLQEDAEGRKRQMKLRTFAVICLNEECGVLEWVNHTMGLRPLVMKAHAFWPEV
jgi:serine/threonine-protein kinase ATR